MKFWAYDISANSHLPSMIASNESATLLNPGSFPGGFKFGCATAAYQVEGAASVDGRGPSIWDCFSRLPGRIFNGDSGDSGCEHYYRYQEDVRLMKWLGLDMYRFSISWSRVMPDGRGKVNEAGLDFYDRLIDTLLEHGIEPWVTLFHWDLPQKIQDDLDGWQNPDIGQLFADYSAIVVKRISDRVQHFFTINEFLCFIDKGYGMEPGHGQFAPGKNLSLRELSQTRHNALVAHGMGVQAIREHAARPVKIGVALNPHAAVPILPSAEHVDAARNAFREHDLNAVYLTPLFEGAYPDAYLQNLGDDAPQVDEADMGVISQPLDFVGLNLYAPLYVRAAESHDDQSAYSIVDNAPGHPRLHMDWLYMEPQIVYWATRFMSELWDVSDIYISENGCAAQDRIAYDGEIYDTGRVSYLREHLLAAQRTVAEGYPLKGYFLWSLMDNFEWAHGYERRFGIFHVDYRTMQRRPKASAKWYREVIRSREVL